MASWMSRQCGRFSRVFWQHVQRQSGRPWPWWTGRPPPSHLLPLPQLGQQGPVNPAMLRPALVPAGRRQCPAVRLRDTLQRWVLLSGQQQQQRQARQLAAVATLSCKSSARVFAARSPLTAACGGSVGSVGQASCRSSAQLSWSLRTLLSSCSGSAWKCRPSSLQQSPPRQAPPWQTAVARQQAPPRHLIVNHPPAQLAVRTLLQYAGNQLQVCFESLCRRALVSPYLLPCIWEIISYTKPYLARVISNGRPGASPPSSPLCLLNPPRACHHDIRCLPMLRAFSLFVPKPVSDSTSTCKNFILLAAKQGSCRAVGKARLLTCAWRRGGLRCR